MEPLIKYEKLTKKNALQITRLAETNNTSHLWVSAALLKSKIDDFRA